MPFKEFTTKNFLGRNNELEGLQGIAAEAANGDASSILLYGKRGTGKTELLKHLYNRLYNQPNDAVPFFYTIKTPFASLEDFSRDYLSNFILQSLSFLHKDSSMSSVGLYSFDDLIYMAHKFEAEWAVEIIDKYLQFKEEGNGLRMFSHAITAPYISYMNTGRAAVVLIDDFHKIRKFCELNLEGGSNKLWTLMGNSVTSSHTPHIIAGCQAELQEMFFEETSLGNTFELMNLQGLASHETTMLLKLIGEIHNVNVDLEPVTNADIFNGNPFYIKSFMQAARQSCRTLTEDGFWQIYLGEVISGKIFTYWTSLLKSYVPQFELRKPALLFLFSLCNRADNPDFTTLSDRLSIKAEDLDSIVNMLQTSGMIETGFSTFGIADDEVLIDVIKALYYREIERAPLTRIKELIMESKLQSPKLVSTPSFDLSIPSASQAELVAIKSLKQAAQFYDVSLEAIGQLQFAMIELFTGVFKDKESLTDRYNLKFYLKDKFFSVEITAPQVTLEMIEEGSDRVSSYLDEMRIEKIMNGVRITLSKEVKEALAPAT